MPQMTMWESVIIVTLFSLAVIVADEVIHARRRRAKEREQGGRQGH
jgi:hypothetical protein